MKTYQINDSKHFKLIILTIFDINSSGIADFLKYIRLTSSIFTYD